MGYEIERNVRHLAEQVNVIVHGFISAGDAAHYFSLLTGEEQVAYSVNAGAVRYVHVNRDEAEESIRRCWISTELKC